MMMTSTEPGNYNMKAPVTDNHKPWFGEEYSE